MTLLVASLFLPYTIDFEAADISRGRNAGPRTQLLDKVEGRLAELHDEGRVKALSMTPGATTEHEKIFKPFYAAQLASDEPQRLTPTEAPGESWGQSRTFNQPQSKAALPPEASILSRPGASEEGAFIPSGDVPDESDPEETGTPRVILSDVDWVVKAAVQGNGGLRNAINAAVRTEVVHDKTWVGTLGMPTDSLKEHTRTKIVKQLREDYDSLAVFVGDGEFEGHYFHFCRNVLYPAFHYQIQESPRHKEYDDHSWKQYVKVNEAFANAICRIWRPGDRIWVHDYHLLLLPAMLRKRLPDAEIGFYMHTAFPSSEVFRCLATREALLEGVLGADLIGFQTDEYCHHFRHTCSRLLRLEVSAEGIHLPDYMIPVRPFPIGIDLASFDGLRKLPEVQGWVLKIRDRYAGKHLIVARDRLDAAGGIKQKLLAYEKFLKKYPELRENVVLIQVASPVPDPADLETQVSKIAMRINSLYSTLTHQPLVLLKQDIPFSQFLALMSVAEVFMITSLREGMNLSGHDFVRCQDGYSSIPQKHGSLILSEFTGSASVFSGHELLVNPWDYQQCAEAIKRALVMSAEQKQKNWELLAARVDRHTASSWCDAYLKALAETHNVRSLKDPATVSSLSIESLKDKYANSHRRLLILEDQATLRMPESPDESLDDRQLDAIKSLQADPNNSVYITSSRTSQQLEPLLKDLPAVGLIAENGCFVREPKNTEWHALLDESGTRDWRWGIRRVMRYFQERTEGTSIEERRFSLTFWYKEAVDRDLALRQASELADQINGSRGDEPIRAVLTNVSVTVEPTNVTKASAADMVLQRLCGRDNAPNFLFVVGASREDESVFRWANDLSQRREVRDVFTITVGRHATAAASFLENDMAVADVLALLNQSAL